MFYCRERRVISRVWDAGAWEGTPSPCHLREDGNPFGRCDGRASPVTPLRATAAGHVRRAAAGHVRRARARDALVGQADSAGPGLGARLAHAVSRGVDWGIASAFTPCL